MCRPLWLIFLLLTLATGSVASPNSNITRGDTGPRGFNGTKGETGTRGEDGPRGDIGPRGAQGIQGIQGPPGDQGDQGLTGAPGIQGIQGIQGTPGKKGETGPRGFKGDKGDMGSSYDIFAHEEIKKLNRKLNQIIIVGTSLFVAIVVGILLYILRISTTGRKKRHLVRKKIEFHM